MEDTHAKDSVRPYSVRAIGHRIEIRKTKQQKSKGEMGEHRETN